MLGSALRLRTKLLMGALLLSAVAVGGSFLVVAARDPEAGRSTPASPRSLAVPAPTEIVPSSASPSPARTCELPTQIGTVVVSEVVARRRPSETAGEVGTFDRTNPQGAPTVFDLLGTARDDDGKLWYRALLPVRPNGTEGFVPATALVLAEVPYRIVVDREDLTLTLRQGCNVVKRFPIGLGKESTPTPNGRFYVISLLKPPNADSVYGSYAYGLSAYSDAITDWKGGGIIGIHGTNEPSSIGDRKSHGCIRMRNEDIEQLVPLLPLGTPVVIR